MFPNFIYDSSQASSIPAEYRPDEHTPPADVARVKQAGGICIKTYYEHGFGRDRHLPVMSAGMFRDVRRAATDAGLVLMVHANSFEAQQFAEGGGADVIAHGMWNWGTLDRSPELPGEITTLLDQIVANQTGYQPTMRVIEGLRVYFDPGYLAMPEIPKVVPPAMLAWFRSPAGAWYRSEIADSGMTDSVERAGWDRGPIRRGRQVVAYLARKDANFLFGTDTPSSPTYGNLPGLNGYLEMKDLHEAGLTLAQIFRAATISNARESKIDSASGRSSRGKSRTSSCCGVPLESVEAYNSILDGAVHGRAIVRDNLAARPVSPAGAHRAIDARSSRSAPGRPPSFARTSTCWRRATRDGHESAGRRAPPPCRRRMLRGRPSGSNCTVPSAGLAEASSPRALEHLIVVLQREVRFGGHRIGTDTVSPASTARASLRRATVN